MHYRNSRYTEQMNSEIRFNILSAIEELAKFRGIDINTIKTTSPYSLVLNNVTSQKIAAEIKKLIDYGMVVKGVAKGKTVKYMLRSTYNELMKDGKINEKEFGYGDYRDVKKKKKDEDAESEAICNRIAAASLKPKYADMW